MTKFLTLMLAVMVSMTIIGCSSDDDSNDNAASLAGTWRMDFDGGYLEIVFNSDGTGTLKNFYETYDYEYSYPFEYTYNESSGRLKVIDSYGDIQIFTVLTVTETKLVMEDEDGYTFSLTKKKSGSGNGESSADVASKLVGTWRSTFTGGYTTMTLNSNGNGTMQEYDKYDGGYGTKHYFTWKYNANTGKLTMTEDGYSEVYIVKSVTSSTLKTTDPDGYSETWTRVD